MKDVLLRKLLYRKGDFDYVVQVGSTVSKGQLEIRRIEKQGERDYVIYASKKGEEEYTAWKTIHIPDTYFKGEEYDYTISLGETPDSEDTEGV